MILQVKPQSQLAPFPKKSIKLCFDINFVG